MKTLKTIKPSGSKTVSIPVGVPAWVEQGGDPTDTYCTSFYASSLARILLPSSNASLQLSH
jgi:hypothetical protein